MSKILIDEATANMALDALCKCRYRALADEIVDPAITALREALGEQPAQRKQVDDSRFERWSSERKA